MRASSYYIICGSTQVVHYRFRVCESTQDVARELRREGPIAVSCGSMSKGRGRLGRKWYAGEGGAWVTVSAKLPAGSVQSILPLAVGARLAEWLRSRYGVDVRVKWPNDLVIEDRKVGGVLIEAVAGEEMRALVGVGINVANDLPDELRPYATRLIDWVDGVSPRDVVEGVICSVITAIHDVAEGQRTVLCLWRRLSDTLGREVWVILDDGELRGVAVDIDDEGALLIQTKEGVRRVLVADVIHLRPTQ